MLQPMCSAAFTVCDVNSFKGSCFDIPLFGANYEPWVVFILPPGGFFTIGFILLGLNYWEKRKKERVAAGGLKESAATGRAA